MPPSPVFNFDTLPAADLNSLIEARSALKIMLASDGWRVYCAYMEQQQLGILNSVVMTPLASSDDIYKQEHDKGRYAALDMVINHAHVLLGDLTSEIDSRPTDADTPPPSLDDTGIEDEDSGTTTLWSEPS